MANDEDVFFVGVKDPVEMRRHVLEIAKGSIQTLQLFEKFRGIRDEKIKYISHLKSDLREISRLISKLKNSLPKAKLRIKTHGSEISAGGAEAKKKGTKKSKEMSGAAEKPVKSDLEKLEDELSAIESKLGDVG